MTDAPASVIVRHGAMRRLGVFTPPAGYALDRRARVIVRTDRGLEVGDPLAVASPEAVAALPDPSRGDIVRTLDAADLGTLLRVEALQADQFATAEKLIAQHRLLMKLVDVELLFGGERAVFYFLADGRVDFRELVKAMAREFKTRIELRQVGPRDEARLKADYGDCGRPVCCNTFLVVMPPVSHADGQAAEVHPGPEQDQRPVRPAQVLPAVRAGRVRGAPGRTAGGRNPGGHPHRPG